MTANTETKSTGTITLKSQTKPDAMSANGELRNAIMVLENEMKETLKNAIDQLVPGASFDPILVKKISRIETQKIRLITSRLELLIRKGNSDVKDVVERLLAISN